MSKKILDNPSSTNQSKGFGKKYSKYRFGIAKNRNSPAMTNTVIQYDLKLYCSLLIITF